MHASNLRLPEPLARVVKNAARRSARSKNQQIVYLIRRGLEADGMGHDLTAADEPADGHDVR